MKAERRQTYFLWTFWLIWVVVAQPLASPLSAQNTSGNFTLRNGVEAFYVQDTSRPLLEVALSVRGGARIDHPGADGIAALWARTFWERGADSLRYSTYGKARGIRTGARQGLSHSQFYLRMLPHRLSGALDLLRFALEDSDYSGTDLNGALRDFALDLQQMDGDPFAFLDQQLGQTLWQERYAEMNPYGYYPDLASPNPKTFRSIHQAYLHPANALLCATGPLPAETFFQVSDSILGGWENYGPQPYLPHTAFPNLTKPSYEVYFNELTKIPQLKMIWPLDGSFRDSSILSLSEWFIQLAQSRQSPFYQNLIRGNLASSFRWEYIPTRGPGQLSLSLAPNLDSLSQCLESIFAGIAQIMQPNPEWLNEIDLAGRGLETQLARRTDIPQNQLFYLSRRWAVGLDPDHPTWKQIPEQADLAAFIERFLFRKPHVAGLLLNSRMAGRKNFEALFVPPSGFTIAPEVVANADASGNGSVNSDTSGIAIADSLGSDSANADSLPPAPSYPWLAEIKIYFNPSSFDPDSISLLGLEKVSQLMLEVDSLRLFVNGYADGQGDGVYNYLLSIQRSESVKQILSNRLGIPEERLIVRGYGEAFAEFPDDTPEHRAKNRRVTFELVPKDFVPNDF